ncbi:MAG: pyridoxal 5'-phosphate synthase glutaminase subunit PdxT [Baekduia sp.]
MPELRSGIERTDFVPSLVVGVLALQGGYAAHEAVFARLGASTRQVKTPSDLDRLDGLVIPGGESTTMTLGIEREGLAGPLRELAQAGTPILGTCAGLIMLDRDHLGIMDIRAERNAFGRQIHSFESDLTITGIDGGPVRAVFIRAPRIADAGPGVEILAAVDGEPVAAREAASTVVAFHPELSGEDRIHAAWLGEVRDRQAAISSPA